jgi:hypothetical protein
MWGKLAYALLVGVFEFIEALGEDVDLKATAKKAMDTVAKNRAAKAKAEKDEDDVFSSVDDTEGEG